MTTTDATLYGEEYTYEIAVDDHGKAMKGEADNLDAARECARALCHHYGATSATITEDPSGYTWTFHAEYLEEDIAG